MKTKKIIVAGCLVREGIYSRAAGREAPKIRAAKRRASTEAQQRINARYSWEKLELMLAANFVPGDLVVTQTYDEENLPEDRAGAQAKLKKFRKELSAARAERGEEMRMIWATEHKLGEGRWHHHCVINATTGSDYAEILRLWPWGSNIEIRPLIVAGEKTYESLARYMTKEAREKPGLRSWSCTRNCRKPEIETFPVPDDETIDVPEDVTVLEEQSKRTESSPRIRGSCAGAGRGNQRKGFNTFIYFSVSEIILLKGKVVLHREI